MEYIQRRHKNKLFAIPTQLGTNRNVFYINLTEGGDIKYV